jgi:hypothetical protein
MRRSLMVVVADHVPLRGEILIIVQLSSGVHCLSTEPNFDIMWF